MRVNNQETQSIWLDEKVPGRVCFIDQTRLPHEYFVSSADSMREAVESIQSMKVRGAPVIGVMGAVAMALAIRDGMNDSSELDNTVKWASEIVSARPTAVNLQRMVDRVLNEIKKPSPVGPFEKALSTVKEIIREEKENCRMIGIHGFPLIEEVYLKKGKNRPVNILTHCNAGWLACIDHGTATSPIYLAHDKGIPIHVWVDETRPRNQGARLTTWELAQHGVPHTLIVDNAGGLLMQQGEVDMVLVGTDRTTLEGTVVNKIGTYLKALAAREHKVPFYVALPSSTLDPEYREGTDEIIIEERDGEEVIYVDGASNGKMEKIMVPAEGTAVKNPGFDVTPPEMVTGLVTERGICRPNKEEILRLFPELR